MFTQWEIKGVNENISHAQNQKNWVKKNWDGNKNQWENFMGRIRAMKLSRKVLNVTILKFKWADSHIRKNVRKL